MVKIFSFLSILLSGIFIACNGNANDATDTRDTLALQNDPAPKEIKTTVLASGLDHPWGMDFLPDGRLLITERFGALRIMNRDYSLSKEIPGTPEVVAKGQGGLLDVAVDPEFSSNKFIYISFAEKGPKGNTSTALGRGVFENDEVKEFQVIFRQEPKTDGNNHFGNRIVFQDNNHLFLALGEKFKFDPAQDLNSHLGKIIRIKKDGSIPADNPFVNQAGAKPEIWSYGHRNIEAAAIDPAGNFWIAEMGPEGGDEMNLVKRGENYGWPLVSHGNHYDGRDIPDHNTRPEFTDAALVWTPVIAPSGMVFYNGSMFPEWKGDALIGGLMAKGIVRVDVNGEQAKEAQRIDLDARTRDVAQAPDGSVYAITDEGDGKVIRVYR